jgi:predicted P-loop ATPase
VYCPEPFTAVSDSTRDELWAEAVHRYRQQEAWWVVDEDLLRAVAEQQEKARHIDVWEDILRDRLAKQKTTSMLEAASLVGIRYEHLNKSVTMRAGVHQGAAQTRQTVDLDLCENTECSYFR